VNRILKVEGITKRYGGTVAVDGVSLTLAPDEVAAIVGPNGAGKSTLLRSIACLETVEAGNAYLGDGQYIKDGHIVCASVEKLRAQIVSVLQTTNLFPNMTVLDNLTFAPRHVHRRALVTATDEARGIAARLGIERLLRRYPNQISGGQAQIVSIARAVLMRPKVLLLDEVTSALSPTSIIAVIDALRWLKTEAENKHLAIIIVTHLMRFATEFAHMIHFMEAGKIIESARAATFLECCSTPQARSFVAANRLPF
jgi:polar amino acid transport system ATP-binding protein